MRRNELRVNSCDSIARASNVSKQHQSSEDPSRESTNKTVDLRDPLQVQVEASEPEGRANNVMTSFIQSSCSRQRVLDSLRTKDLFVGPMHISFERRHVHHPDRVLARKPSLSRPNNCHQITNVLYTWRVLSGTTWHVGFKLIQYSRKVLQNIKTIRT